MPTNPLHTPLKKAALRHLLAPSPTAKPPSAAALRNARQWAIAANLLDERGLTAEGELVISKDPYLETTVTDWLIHFNVSSGDHKLWKYFVYQFLPRHSKFTQDELLEHCTQAFPNESAILLRKLVRLILKSYTSSEAIVKNQFLTRLKDTYFIGSSNLSNPYTIGYLLAKVWERNFGKQLAVLIDVFIDAEMGLASVLGIGKEQLQQQFDALAEHGIIEQRSAKPHLSNTKPPMKASNDSSYQVYRCWETAIELLEQAYENDIVTPNRPLIQSLGAILDNDEDTLDFSKFLQWASSLVLFDGGSNTITKVAS